MFFVPLLSLASTNKVRCFQKVSQSAAMHPPHKSCARGIVGVREAKTRRQARSEAKAVAPKSLVLDVSPERALLSDIKKLLVVTELGQRHKLRRCVLAFKPRHFFQQRT